MSCIRAASAPFLIKHELQLLAARLEKDSPVARLSGGYGFVTGEDGKNVTSIRQLQKGETLTVQLCDGSAKAKVQEIMTGRNRQEETGRGTEKVRQ